jgi:hypothetical protein
MRRAAFLTACMLPVSALLPGCATKPPEPAGMVATPASVIHKSSGGVTIAVSGGQQTSGMALPQISDDAFSHGLRESIMKSGLFSSASEGAMPYRLSAYIGQLSQPTMGFSMTVRMEVSYKLIDTQTNSPLWTRSIQSEYTARAGEAFDARERVRFASEGAARENIAQAIEAISALNLR